MYICVWTSLYVCLSLSRCMHQASAIMYVLYRHLSRGRQHEDFDVPGPKPLNTKHL